jgi:hypothetical protein
MTPLPLFFDTRKVYEKDISVKMNFGGLEHEQRHFGSVTLRCGNRTTAFHSEEGWLTPAITWLWTALHDGQRL